MDVIQLIEAAFAALVGFPAVLTAVGNLLAYFAPSLNLDAFYFWANVIGFGVVAFFVFTGQLDVLSNIDAALSGLAKLLADVLIIIGGAAGSLFFNYRMHAKLASIKVSSFKA